MEMDRPVERMGRWWWEGVTKSNTKTGAQKRGQNEGIIKSRENT